ncbi:MAG: hypothetical protein Q4C65_14095 [Eubacteriales bacterium]|nr:hypothetical protein [Eubacteriales bacterium]
MSKGSREAAESALCAQDEQVRLCEWRGLNGYFIINFFPEIKILVDVR